jgi:signal transduction histidine kinase
MKTLVIVLLVLLIAGALTAVVIVRRILATFRTQRIVRGAAAKQAEGMRRHAEAHYAVEKLQADLERARSGEKPADPRLTARLGELQDVFRRAETPERTAFPVSGPCAEVIDSFRGEAGDRDLLYSESGDGRWLQVLGDRDLLKWVVNEIFRNVVAHAGSWTRITVKAEPVDGAILLTLRDDGIGLDRPATTRIYTAFSPRLGSTGPGVGLFLVRRIVETFGGRTEARSAPGGGVLHSLWLPYPPEGPYGAAGRTPNRRVRERVS